MPIRREHPRPEDYGRRTAAYLAEMDRRRRLAFLAEAEEIQTIAATAVLGGGDGAGDANLEESIFANRAIAGSNDFAESWRNTEVQPYWLEQRGEWVTWLTTAPTAARVRASSSSTTVDPRYLLLYTGRQYVQGVDVAISWVAYETLPGSEGPCIVLFASVNGAGELSGYVVEFLNTEANFWEVTDDVFSKVGVYSYGFSSTGMTWKVAHTAGEFLLYQNGVYVDSMFDSTHDTGYAGLAHMSTSAAALYGFGPVTLSAS